jgi:hypothetical protein
MIERALWITTDLFEASTPDPDFINPRCFGEDFADWLAARLAQRGIDAAAPIQEDFGWVIMLKSAQSIFTLSLGIMDESIKQVPAVWRIGVAYEKPLNPIKSWFKRAPVETLQLLFQEVQSIVRGEPGFIVSTDEP